MGMDSQAEIVRLRTRVTELEREKEAVERFAAVAAHELLTPVVLIDACAATVADRLDGDERHVESRAISSVLRRGCAQSRLLVESLLHHAAAADRPLASAWSRSKRSSGTASLCWSRRSARDGCPWRSASSRSFAPSRR